MFTLGDSSAKSTVKNFNLNPVWNETYPLYVRKGDGSNKLLVRCMDKDYADEDDPMGTIYIDVSDKLDGKEHDIAFTYADLNLRNILDDEDRRILGIVDWECSG